MNKQFFEINKASWNKKAAIHVESDFYENEAFLAGKCSLKSIELNLLGNVSSQSVLHLQCHFGQDSLSLARRGAKVTGIDISDKAIKYARKFNRQLGLDAQFIVSNVYDTSNYVNEQFDIVFTSYGVIGWLPDLGQWAKVISSRLKPNGSFVMVEFHPVVWMFDDHFKKFKYSYFNKEVILESYSGTYADKDANITAEYAGWNHSLAEVIQPLLDQGLQMEVFEEYDYSPYDCFEHTAQIEQGKFQIKNMQGKMPMTFALKMKKI